MEGSENKGNFYSKRADRLARTYHKGVPKRRKLFLDNRN
jgi:hypothetical protein